MNVIEKSLVLAKFLTLSEFSTQKCGNPWNETSNSEYVDALFRMKLSHSARQSIVLLYKTSQLNQRQLALQLNISPQAMSETVKKLLHHGCINKENGAQKNENLITLTELGCKIALLLQEIIDCHAKDFFAPLAEEEIALFEQMLEKLIFHQKQKENLNTILN